MRKKELIKRIELLERQVKGIKSPILIDAEMDAKILNKTEFMRDNIYTLGKTVEMWKQVFYTSGIVSRCEADRTEYQWDEQPSDILGRNYHFKVNKVVTE